VFGQLAHQQKLLYAQFQKPKQQLNWLRQSKVYHPDKPVCFMIVTAAASLAAAGFTKADKSNQIKMRSVR
jgi:hypothetical protein